MLRMSQIAEELLPGHPVGALTGPNLAKEIMDGQAAASVIGMEDLVVAEALQPVFASGLFRVYTNHDPIGCELGGALKNVIAIATGMAESLSVGDNTRSMVVTRGLAEITRLGVAMGGESATFAGLAGLGDSAGDVHEPAEPQPTRRRATRSRPIDRRDHRRDEHGRRGRQHDGCRAPTGRAVRRRDADRRRNLRRALRRAQLCQRVSRLDPEQGRPRTRQRLKIRTLGRERPMTNPQALYERLTASGSGSPFEMATRRRPRSQPMDVLANRPRSLPELLEGSLQHADRDFIVCGDRRTDLPRSLRRRGERRALARSEVWRWARETASPSSRQTRPSGSSRSGRRRASAPIVSGAQRLVGCWRGRVRALRFGTDAA